MYKNRAFSLFHTVASWVLFWVHYFNHIYFLTLCHAVPQVNLTGSEGKLAYEMQQQVLKAANDNVRYEEFDFHKECGKNGWGRLDVLISRLQNEQDEFG